MTRASIECVTFRKGLKAAFMLCKSDTFPIQTGSPSLSAKAGKAVGSCVVGCTFG